MNLFHHLSPVTIFKLIREKLQTEPFSIELRTLLEACLYFDLLRSTSLLARIGISPDEAAQLERVLATPFSPCAQEALSEQADRILSDWVRLLYVDGGFKPNGRSAWAVYDLKRDRLSSGRGHCSSSTEAEWKALLQGCRYATDLSESLVLIYTDAISLLDQLEAVDKQTEMKREFAWAKYRNPLLLELCDYREAYPIKLIWANRETPGIARADQACDRVLGKNRKKQ